MPRGKDERILRMIESYVRLWESGMAPKEIAAYFGLSPTCMYGYLEEIARNSGRYTRQQLLERHVPAHRVNRIRIITGNVEKIDTEKFDKQLETIEFGIKEMKDLLQKSIKTGEEFEALAEEDCKV